jgi:hypothetical protein
MTETDDLDDVSETDLGEQLDQLEAELAKNPEPPADEPGARYAWGEDVYLDALEGACFATELNRQESITKLFRLVARGSLAVMTSTPAPGEDGAEPDGSAANPFTYIQGVSAALVIDEKALLTNLAKVDPSDTLPEEVPIGQAMLEFAFALRSLAGGDEGTARQRLAIVLGLSPDDMELEELYWFRLARLLDNVLGDAGDLDQRAMEMAYAHSAVYMGPDLEDDPGAYLALPLAATRVLAHQRGKPFEYPEELDQEVLEDLVNEYEGEGIDDETLELLIRAATQSLLAGDTLEKASDAIRALSEEEDDELAVGLATDVAFALKLVVGEDDGDDSDINDETTLEDLAEKLVENGVPPEAAIMILQVIAAEIEAADTGEDD